MRAEAVKNAWRGLSINRILIVDDDLDLGELLARYFTSPLVKLRAATRQLAAGNLSAHTSGAMRLPTWGVILM